MIETRSSAAQARAVVRRWTAALGLFVGACAAQPEAGSVQPAGGQGPRHDIEVHAALARSVVTVSITNNTQSPFEFRTLIQWLDREGGDVAPAALGPELTVAAASTSKRWTFAVPTLPNGYGRYFVTVLGMRAGTDVEQESTAEEHLRVRRGRVAVVDYFEFENGGPVVPTPAPVPDKHLAPRFVRAPGEWQGMLQEPGDVWPCMPDGSCSQARACVAGQCVPCLTDAECVGDELCVIGHCVRGELVACSSHHDCGGQPCLLSGYTPLDHRGNGDMQAYCPGTLRVPTEAEFLAESQAIEAANAAYNATLPPAPPGPPSPGERAMKLLRRR